MAINKNHEFEELDGVKCGIVEKNVLPGRVEFLKNITISFPLDHWGWILFHPVLFRIFSG